MIIVMSFLHNTHRSNDFSFIHKDRIQTYARLVFISKLATIYGLFSK